ncbi:MAG: hypothetical protein EXS09_06620 [Gemmataceae bacterium]|nr:hypothetical protein [Gemmataceae bacterium]
MKLKYLLMMIAIVSVIAVAMMVPWLTSKQGPPSPNYSPFFTGRIESIRLDPESDHLVVSCLNQEPRVLELSIPATTPIYLRNGEKTKEVRPGQIVTVWVSYFSTDPGPPKVTVAGAKFIIIEPED